ncbi:MAG: ATP phosphoribosyltransferase regulatory subunit [Caldilinea sp.]|nr:ATP phosphoribosyltransferase regulatory subunit [Caldilinea sp.]MDW8440740.1 ATP phosphoribosyltransferase regulatory subunit [Caldilineaceae bacterium]
MTGETRLRPIAAQTPTGVADYFWREAYERRKLESLLLDLFRRWGYSDVVTPTFEYAETFGERGSDELQSELCRFLDRDGSMLALRADMTIPVARLVGTRLHDAPLPQRYCYSGSVFRDVELRAGQQREFWQVGVELMGSAAPEADAEVLALTAEALQVAGITHFRLVVGQMQFFEGLLQALQLSPDARARLTEAIDRNSQPALEAFLRETRLSRRQQRALSELPYLGGEKIDAILRRAEKLALNKMMQAAVTNLCAICEVLAAQGVLDYVTLDLSEIHNLGYYTGITFEALAPGVGFRIASGGRYDNLVGTFGAAMPAVGVGLGVERILLARRKGAAPPPPRPPAPDLIVATGNHPDAFACVAQARRIGLTVALDLEHRCGAELCAYAQSIGARAAVDWRDGSPLFWDLSGEEPASAELTVESTLHALHALVEACDAASASLPKEAA